MYVENNYIIFGVKRELRNLTKNGFLTHFRLSVVVDWATTYFLPLHFYFWGCLHFQQIVGEWPLNIFLDTCMLENWCTCRCNNAEGTNFVTLAFGLQYHFDERKVAKIGCLSLVDLLTFDDTAFLKFTNSYTLWNKLSN